MRVIVITTAFDGYPAGRLRAFAVGERPTDLEDGYAAMLVDKGLAADIRDDAPAAEPTNAAE